MEPLISPHWESLTPETIRAFRMVSEFSVIEHFYLAGGTGLALQLGHRFSVDLDFFTEKPDALLSDEREILHQGLNDPTLQITNDKDATFTAIWQDVGISFFRLSMYPLVQEPRFLDGIRVASIQEIGAMKLAAIIGRGVRKDMIDLYFILQLFPLEEIFKIASKKYAQVRSFPVHAIRAMAYFKDAEAFPMPRMLDRTPWSKMKRYLEQQAFMAGKSHLEEIWDEPKI